MCVYERYRERVCVSVCVSVCERGRERKKKKDALQMVGGVVITFANVREETESCRKLSRVTQKTSHVTQIYPR